MCVCVCVCINIYCNIPITKKKKKKKGNKKEKKKEEGNGQILFGPHDFIWTTCAHLPHLTPTTHLTNISILFGRPSLISYLFLFLFFSLKHTPLYHSHPLPLVPPCHHLHHLFSGNVIGKSLREPRNPFTSFF